MISEWSDHQHIEDCSLDNNSIMVVVVMVALSAKAVLVVVAMMTEVKAIVLGSKVDGCYCCGCGCCLQCISRYIRSSSICVCIVNAIGRPHSLIV